MLVITDRFLTFYCVITKRLDQLAVNFDGRNMFRPLKPNLTTHFFAVPSFPLCLPLLELLYHPKDSERLTESRATGCVSSLRLVKAKLLGQGTLHVEHVS